MEQVSKLYAEQTTILARSELLQADLERDKEQTETYLNKLLVEEK